MSKPNKTATDQQVTFRQAIPTMLWMLGIIAVVVVGGAVLGIKTPDQKRLDRFKPVEHNFDHLTKSTRR